MIVAVGEGDGSDALISGLRLSIETAREAVEMSDLMQSEV